MKREMDKIHAKKILEEAIMADNSLHALDWYLRWNLNDKDVVLDGQFTADELEAIAWWMRNTK